ncbi:MAG: hypothetical protein GY869_07535 [Planctomycetes bacterium]|nr:hypothetical protein [Planctomycetota bacterium]
MKYLNHVLLLMIVAALLLTVGCNGPKQELFQQGQVDTIRFVRSDSYRNWVEMPDQPPTMESSRLLTEEIVLTREVETLNPDGSVILKVTFDQVNITDNRIVQGTENLFQYISNSQETKSTKPGEPPLAGASYRVKLAPDTSVQEIVGLTELRQQLELPEGSVGLAALMLSERRIKKCHEREFLQSGVQSDKPATKLFPVEHEMNKAKALEKTFIASLPGTNTMSVSMTGEAVYVLPDGWTEPPQPVDPFRPQIKELSDMQPPEIIGESIFDQSTKKVLQDNYSVKCLLILPGNKIAQRVDNKEVEDDGGLMFTEIKLEHKFETIK